MRPARCLPVAGRGPRTFDFPAAVIEAQRGQALGSAPPSASFAVGGPGQAGGGPGRVWPIKEARPPSGWAWPIASGVGWAADDGKPRPHVAWLIGAHRSAVLRAIDEFPHGGCLTAIAMAPRDRAGSFPPARMCPPASSIGDAYRLNPARPGDAMVLRRSRIARSPPWGWPVFFASAQGILLPQMTIRTARPV